MDHDSLPLLSADTALFLDVDGTLLDLAPTPDAVRVPPGVRETLRALQAGLGGGLALVSGRSLASIDVLFDPLRLPAAGQHGGELRRRADGPVVSLGRDPGLDRLSAQATAYADARPGVVVEDKGLSVAFHYRQAPHYQDETRRFATDLAREGGAGFELMPMHLGIEVKPRGISKRSAIEWFMREVPFRARVPVFAGDDRTDEDGFAAVLQLGGRALRVGPDEPSIAPTRIASPQAVRDWLAASAEALRRRE